MILPLTGDDLGVYRNDNHVLCEWQGDGRVVFSATRKGDAIFFHFAAEKKALRQLKLAMLEYIDLVLDSCEWCTMLVTAISKPSVCRLAESVGGIFIAEDSEGMKIYMRLR